MRGKLWLAWVGVMAVGFGLFPRSPAQAAEPSTNAPAASQQALADAKRLEAEVAELHEQGKLAEALSIAQRVLALREKVLGAEHPDVASALDDLGTLYRERGDYGRAESLFQRELAIMEKTRGPDHPDVHWSLNNLALLYHDKGDYGRAEPLYLRALAIREKALGPDHPNVATPLNNLALLYHDKGDYGRAELLCQRALAIREKALGADHSDVVQSLNTLAMLYAAQGRKGEAVNAARRGPTLTIATPPPFLPPAPRSRSASMGPRWPTTPTKLSRCMSSTHPPTRPPRASRSPSCSGARAASST